MKNINRTGLAIKVSEPYSPSMMKYSAVTIGLIVVLLGLEAMAKCKTDMDCKYDRLCFDGVCRNPPTEEHPPPPGTIKWFRVYFELSAVASVHTWGEVESTAKYYPAGPELPGKDTAAVNWGVAPGIRLALYGVTHKLFHVGGYLSVIGGTGEIDPNLPSSYSWIPDEDKSTIFRTGFGLAGKFGFRPTNILFMGLGLDGGAQFVSIPTWEDEYVFDAHTFTCLELVPKLFFDIVSEKNGKARFAIPITVGLVIVPSSQLSLQSDALDSATITIEGEEYYTEILRFKMWHISPVVSIGLSWGS